MRRRRRKVEAAAVAAERQAAESRETTTYIYYVSDGGDFHVLTYIIILFRRVRSYSLCAGFTSQFAERRRPLRVRANDPTQGKKNDVSFAVKFRPSTGPAPPPPPSAQ